MQKLPQFDQDMAKQRMEAEDAGEVSSPDLTARLKHVG